MLECNFRCLLFPVRFLQHGSILCGLKVADMALVVQCTTSTLNVIHTSIMWSWICNGCEDASWKCSSVGIGAKPALTCLICYRTLDECVELAPFTCIRGYVDEEHSNAQRFTVSESVLCHVHCYVKSYVEVVFSLYIFRTLSCDVRNWHWLYAATWLTDFLKQLSRWSAESGMYCLGSVLARAWWQGPSPVSWLMYSCIILCAARLCHFKRCLCISPLACWTLWVRSVSVNSRSVCNRLWVASTLLATLYMMLLSGTLPVRTMLKSDVVACVLLYGTCRPVACTWEVLPPPLCLLHYVVGSNAWWTMVDINWIVWDQWVFGWMCYSHSVLWQQNSTVFDLFPVTLCGLLLQESAFILLLDVRWE